MTAVAHAHPTISPFAIANGMLHVGGHPVGLLAECTGATHDNESRGHTFLVDGGLHHQFAALWNFGQVIRKTNYPVASANRLGVPDAETVGVAGCLCTPLDLLALDVCLPRAEIGDLVAAFRADAYRMTPVLQRSSAIRHRKNC
ncbi:hypothetical protein [Amycolatopsis sp. NPDC051372]|uniref:hypothetical protein n=1 Tax=Amycolatopsis sp. NPDC051372 TaxID=3155669 RepID=UPI00342C48AE